jgi:MFS family permease
MPTNDTQTLDAGSVTKAAANNTVENGAGTDAEAITERTTEKSTDKGNDVADADAAAPKPFKKGPAFWLVIFSICLIGFTAALDGSIIAISLPRISSTLGIGNDYVAVANCFVFAQTVVQPGIAQMCDIFGRRWPMIISICVFAVGSGVAGGALGTGAMIAGRTVQGIGSGGIMLLVELVVCDIVPLRERGQYLGLVLSSAALGSIVGPVVGGALADTDWRWCFYINLPICAVVLPLHVSCFVLDMFRFRGKISSPELTGSAMSPSLAPSPPTCSASPLAEPFTPGARGVSLCPSL